MFQMVGPYNDGFITNLTAKTDGKRIKKISQHLETGNSTEAPFITHDGQ